MLRPEFTAGQIAGNASARAQLILLLLRARNETRERSTSDAQQLAD